MKLLNLHRKPLLFAGLAVAAGLVLGGCNSLPTDAGALDEEPRIEVLGRGIAAPEGDAATISTAAEAEAEEDAPGRVRRRVFRSYKLQEAPASTPQPETLQELK